MRSRALEADRSHLPRSFCAWAICARARLPPWCAAVVSPPAIAPSPTTPATIPKSSSPAASRAKPSRRISPAPPPSAKRKRRSPSFVASRSSVQLAHYGGLRCKPVLTVVGRVEVSRPYDWCPHCQAGQFPADRERDIANTEFLPGSAPHAGPGGPGGAFRSWAGTNESPRRLGGAPNRWSVRRRPSAPISRGASQGKSRKPCRWTFPPSRGSRFPSSTCKWMGRECRW